MRGLTETLSAGGYQVLLGQTGYDQDAEEALVAAFLGRRVDGMVITGVSHSALTRRRLTKAGIPVVETWDLTPKPIDMVVGFSNHDAGFPVQQLTEINRALSVLDRRPKWNARLARKRVLKRAAR